MSILCILSDGYSGRTKENFVKHLLSFIMGKDTYLSMAE